MIKSINPTTGQTMKQYSYMDKNQVDQAISQAQQAFHERKQTTFQYRAGLFHKLAEIMDANFEELAKLNTLEMWMLFKDAQWDVKKSAVNVRFFADNAERLLADKPFDEWWLKGKIVYEPLGVLFSVSPWNYPFNQVLRNAVPNIMAGNVVLMKHASNVPQVAEKIERLFQQAGFPKWVYQNMFLNYELTEYIISHPAVRWSNCTWSEKVWKEIGQFAWQYLKPSVLELWWSDSFILMHTDDVDKIIPFAIQWRFSNAWQKCNSSKRFIILESVYDEFCTKFAEAVSNLKVWDPMLADTKIWPLAKKNAVFGLDQQVQDSIKAGAKLLTGGKIIEWEWNFYTPTVIGDVKPWMRVFDEETFWPVAAVCKAKDIEDIIALANNSVFGLWASIFGDDAEQKSYIASKLDVANVSINRIVTSYAFLPYGWIKNTGYGKELGEQWIKTFTNEKVIIY